MEHRPIDRTKFRHFFRLSLLSVAFSPVSDDLATVLRHNTVAVTDAKGHIKYKLDGTTGQLRSWSPDGKLLAIASSQPLEKNDVVIFKGENEKLRISENSMGVRGLAWSPNGKLLAVWDGSSKVTLWDISQPEQPLKNAAGVGFAHINHPNPWTTDRSCPRWSPDGADWRFLSKVQYCSFHQQAKRTSSCPGLKKISAQSGGIQTVKNCSLEGR